jgi:hypothetical protein
LIIVIKRGILKVKKWVKENLWDDLHFTPDKIWNKTNFYKCDYSMPFVCYLITGHENFASWEKNEGKNLAISFFENIKKVVRKYKASSFYITDPDNALSVFEWEIKIKPEYFNVNILEEFQLNPAKEGGVSYLGLFFHNYKGITLFELDPESLEINFYGENDLLNEIKEVLY